MAGSSDVSSTATVVELSGFRSAARSGIRSGNNALRVAPNQPKRQAAMLSMRQHLGYQASVEIDKFAWISSEYGDSVRNQVVKQVRNLLNTEFGKLRVHRYRRLYIIRHRSVEGLISSLLRVQFHAHQIELPTVNQFGDEIQSSPVTLTWGVGRTTVEAEVERLRRRRQKFRR